MAKIENAYMLESLTELSVANFYAYEKKSGIEYYSGTLKSHELTNGGSDPTKVKGGQSNDVFYTIPQSKELSLKVTDIFNDQSIASAEFGGEIKETGTDIVKGFHMPKNYTVKYEDIAQHYEKCISTDVGALKVVGTTPSTGEIAKTDVIGDIPDVIAGDYVLLVDASNGLYIELLNIPADGEEVIAYNNITKKKIDSAKFIQDTTNKKKFAITETGIQEGDTVFVTGFYFKLNSTTKYSRISSDGTMPEIMVVIELPIYNDSNDIVAYKQYIFPRAQMSAKNASSKGETEKKEVNKELTIEILKDRSLNYLGTIVYLDPSEAISEA